MVLNSRSVKPVEEDVREEIQELITKGEQNATVPQPLIEQQDEDLGQVQATKALLLILQKTNKKLSRENLHLSGHETAALIRSLHAVAKEPIAPLMKDANGQETTEEKFIIEVRRPEAIEA